MSTLLLDQFTAATRDDYALAIAALRQQYLNDLRIQLQKHFQSRKMKNSKENAQDFLTELQRLALDAYPDIAARVAAGGRPAVAAEDRAQERQRRVKETFIIGMPTKIKRFLVTQPEEMTVEDLCSKATSRIIVNRLYPKDDDTAFNELRGTSSKDFFAGIEELGKAQSKFQVDTNKITEELKELTKSINTATLNEVSTNSQTQPQQNNQNNNQRGN